MNQKPFDNGLSPAESERLALLTEELGEILQIIGKIGRHGYESVDPTKPGSPTNRQLLQNELGDFQMAKNLMVKAKDLNQNEINAGERQKAKKVWSYLHHQINHQKVMPPKTRTFALLKPDSVKESKVGIIYEMIQAAGFVIVQQEKIESPTATQVESNLDDLRQKNLEAFNRNIGFLLEGPIIAIMLERQNTKDPVTTFRELVGPTNPAVAPTGTIRQLSKDTLEKAEAEGRGLANLIHAADSIDAAHREASIWLS